MRHIVVIGLGRFGSAIAEALSNKDCEVLIIDRDEKTIEKLEPLVTQAICLDATDEEALKEAGIKDFDVGIVAVGEDAEASILVTMLLKEFGVKEVLAKATDNLHAKILRKMGCDKVVFPERDMGQRLAESLLSPKIFDYIELSSTHSLIEIDAPKFLEGKTLKEAALRSQYGASVIAVKRKTPIIKADGDTEFKETTIIGPAADEEIQRGDRLCLLGENEGLIRIKKL
jgi:trk system potassium uptake protein TrkA